MGKNSLDTKRQEISLCMIVENEEKELVECLKSIHKYVDEIVAVWNGINPATEKILKTFGAKIVKVSRKTHPDFWVTEKRIDFHKQRQLSFDEASHKLVMWVDADDTVEHAENIRKLLMQFEDPRLGALWMYYDYERDQHENTTMACWRERILRKEWFSWEGVVHEEALKKIDCIQAKIPKSDCHIKHHPKKDRVEKSGVRNLEISQAQYIKERDSGEMDPLTIWNYAKSLNAMNFIDNALEIFLEFIQATDSDPHRYQALNETSKILRKMHQFDKALEMDLNAVKLKPKWPWAYFGLAKTYFCLEEWDNVLFYTEMGYKLGDPTDTVPIAYDPMALKVRPLQPLVYALVQRARFEEALVATKKALEFIPSDEYFNYWKNELPKLIERENVEKNCLELYSYLQKEDSGNGKMESFSRSLPEIVKDHPVFIRLQNQFKKQGSWKNRLVIYCGVGAELWDPLSIKHGIGGSEEAVIYLSKYLAKLGWNVEVYNNCLDEGNYDGVLWQGIWKYDNSQKCGIFISWRDSRPVMYSPEGSYCVVWLHDIWDKARFTYQELERIDKIFVLSEWHRTCMPDIPNDKFWVTTNGIISKQFDQKIRRDPYSCIYASSPDRGLDRVLKAWPKIREAVPEAILHVFYGFTKNYDIIHKNNQKMKDFKSDMLEALRQQGVQYHGRIPHQELAQWFLSSGLWLYPSSFTEISCITAMKAQASGLIPITTQMAALKETVKFGVKVGNKFYNDEKGQVIYDIGKDELDYWLNRVIYYLKHPHKQDGIRKRMMPWAREQFDWEKVAERWDKFFKEAMHEKVQQDIRNRA